VPAHPWRGIVWMLGAVFSFAAMAISVRQLITHMSVAEILELRTVVTLVVVSALVIAHGRAVIATQRLPLHSVRALVHLAGQYCWSYAIGALTLATVFAIEFTMPIWVALLAAAFLHERLNRGRIVQLVLGLAGVLIILRPGAGVLHPAAFVMLLGSLFYAGNMIFTKRLSSTESGIAVTFWMSVVQLPVTVIAAWSSWVAPRLADAPWILVIGVGSFAAHYSITQAMKLAPATVVVPIDFIRLPLIAVVGALFYAERFQPLVIVGAAVIFIGTYYSLRHDTRR
jgi:drug/metabolite transporter (DMT)-like permease